jgi:vacuolar-type H+-ATPase subunit E/Vma4
MSVETILALIAHEAEAEAERLLAAARTDADARVRAAEATAETTIADACARAEPRLASDAHRRVNATRRRLMERRAAAAAARVDGAFALAGLRLTAIADGSDPERWLAALDRLVREAIGIAGPDAVVEVRGRDAAGLEPSVAALGARLLSIPDDEPAGVVVRSGDRRLEVDATIPVRLARARTAQAEPVATALELERSADGEP